MRKKSQAPVRKVFTDAEVNKSLQTTFHNSLMAYGGNQFAVPHDFDALAAIKKFAEVHKIRRTEAAVIVGRSFAEHKDFSETMNQFPKNEQTGKYEILSDYEAKNAQYNQGKREENVRPQRATESQPVKYLPVEQALDRLGAKDVNQVNVQAVQSALDALKKDWGSFPTQRGRGETRPTMEELKAVASARFHEKLGARAEIPGYGELHYTAFKTQKDLVTSEMIDEFKKGHGGSGKQVAYLIGDAGGYKPDEMRNRLQEFKGHLKVAGINFGDIKGSNTVKSAIHQIQEALNSVRIEQEKQHEQQHDNASRGPKF